MIRINLLPHRAEKRRRRKIQFAALSGVSVLLGVAIVGLGYGFMSARIFYQEKRNDYLKSEIAKLDKQIEEIKRLRQQVKALLARKEVVEGLQSTRSDVVHLMDQMLRILPQGVYLRSLRQNGDQISITGIAQSSARVSTLMHAIDESPWLSSPHLIEVQSTIIGKERTNQFSMTLKLTNQPAASAPAAVAAAAASAPVAARPGNAAVSVASAPAQTGVASAPASTHNAAASQVMGAAPAAVLSKKR